MADEQGVDVEAHRARMFAGRRARDISSPEDVANLALFLASDESRTITGQSIPSTPAATCWDDRLGSDFTRRERLGQAELCLVRRGSATVLARQRRAYLRLARSPGRRPVWQLWTRRPSDLAFSTAFNHRDPHVPRMSPGPMDQMRQFQLASSAQPRRRRSTAVIRYAGDGSPHETVAKGSRSMDEKPLAGQATLITGGGGGIGQASRRLARSRRCSRRHHGSSRGRAASTHRRGIRYVRRRRHGGGGRRRRRARRRPSMTRGVSASSVASADRLTIAVKRRRRRHDEAAPHVRAART